MQLLQQTHIGQKDFACDLCDKQYYTPVRYYYTHFILNIFSLNTFVEGFEKTHSNYSRKVALFLRCAGLPWKFCTEGLLQKTRIINSPEPGHRIYRQSSRDH